MVHIGPFRSLDVLIHPVALADALVHSTVVVLESIVGGEREHDRAVISHLPQDVEVVAGAVAPSSVAVLSDLDDPGEVVHLGQVLVPTGPVFLLVCLVLLLNEELFLAELAHQHGIPSITPLVVVVAVHRMLH